MRRHPVSRLGCPTCTAYVFDVPHDPLEEGLMTVRFKRFSGSLTKIDELCEEASAFASAIPPDRLIGITQSSDGVTVWYRAAE